MAKKLNKLGVENSLWNNIRANKGPAKKPNGEPTRKTLALRKWNC